LILSFGTWTLGISGKCLLSLTGSTHLNMTKIPFLNWIKMEQTTLIFLKSNWDLLQDYIAKRKWNRDWNFNILDLGIIKNERNCENCNSACQLEISQSKSITISNLKWHCTKCRFKFSIFKGSISYNKKIDLKQFYLLCHFWAASCFSLKYFNFVWKRRFKAFQSEILIKRNHRPGFIREIRFSLLSIFQVFFTCLKILKYVGTKYLNTMITLLGPVEIDECYLGEKVRGNHGRIPHPSEIIFGIKCRTTNILLLFPVQNKTKSPIPYNSWTYELPECGEKNLKRTLYAQLWNASIDTPLNKKFPLDENLDKLKRKKFESIFRYN